MSEAGDQSNGGRELPSDGSIKATVSAFGGLEFSARA